MASRGNAFGNEIVTLMSDEQKLLELGDACSDHYLEPVDVAKHEAEQLLEPEAPPG